MTPRGGVTLRAFLLALFAVLTVACGGSGAARPAVGEVPITVALANETFTLPNGLVVVLHPEKSAMSVVVHVRYHVGAKDDPEGRAGFAHLFEHLMFRGSKHTGNDFGTWVDGVGAAYNATTGLDSTDYFEQLPARQLPLALWLEADRMAYPLANLDDEGFARERDVVANEYRERHGNVAYGNVSLIAQGAVFGASHPYARSPIGRLDELSRSTLDEARAFARTYYRPNLATLVVCGAFDPAVARELVQRYFATIPPGVAPPPRTFPAPRLGGERRIEVDADVDAPMFVYAWPAPAMHGDGYEELQLGVPAVGGWLYWRLVQEKQIAVEVDTRIVAARLAGAVLLTVKTKPGVSVSQVTSVVDEYLTYGAQIGRVGRWPTFADHKTGALAKQVFRLEGLFERADRMLHDVEYHGSADAMQADLRRIHDVAIQDVGAAVDHFLAGAPRVVVVVNPVRGAPRAGRPRS